MILRPRQLELVEKAVTALKEHGNTLAVAPTGAGKTVILSAVCGRLPGASLILQHRDELVAQNRSTFKRVNPDISSDIYTADRKHFVDGGATFAMVQTLCREQGIAKMRPVDFLVIDEAHHTAAVSYKKIIDHARELNPSLMIFGVTATPMRADKKALKGVFNNVCDIINITELIQSGHLVRPRTFVVECGIKEELEAVRQDMNRRRLEDYDMTKVSEIMDKSVVNERVYEEWVRVAGARRTVIFCSTVEHANHINNLFVEKGVRSEIVTGNHAAGERRATLKRLDTGETQVVVNVAVLTEGFDCQPLSCVVLLRPCSHKSTMLQMIGRGLRRVDPERYKGIRKDDCIVLDFGYSLLTHGNLNIDVDLDPEKKTLQAIKCPECGTLLPASTIECPICGEILREIVLPSAPVGDIEKEALSDFALTELDIIDASPFRWEDKFGGVVSIANAIDAWAVILLHGPSMRWHAVGGGKALAEEGTRPFRSMGNHPDRFTALAIADDFMRQYGNRDAARKSKTWLSLPPTDAQMSFLGLSPEQAFKMTRYRACCDMTWKMNEGRIQKIVTANT